MDPSDAEGPEVGTPGQVFGAVASQTRFEILEVLFDAGDTGRSFSEIREQIGMRDSGQFNYHLGQLLDTFVQKTGDRYRLRYAGKQLVGAVLAGVYTREREIQTIDLDQDCRLCGGPLLGTYGEEVLEVFCSDCGERVSSYQAPPGVFDPYDLERLPQIVDRWFKLLLARTAAGFCALCLGPLSAEIGRVDSGFDESIAVQYHCDRCGHQIDTVAGGIVLDHPAVISFHHRHGIDIHETPIWALDWLFDGHASEPPDSPGAVEIFITLDEETMSLLVDEDAQVIGVETTVP